MYLVRVFLHVLDGLQDPQGLLYIPSKGQVVDGRMLDVYPGNHMHDSRQRMHDRH